MTEGLFFCVMQSMMAETEHYGKAADMICVLLSTNL